MKSTFISIGRSTGMIILVALFLSFEETMAAEGSREEAVSLLKKTIEGQALLNHASWKLTVDSSVSISGKHSGGEREEIIVRRDGDRLDVRGKELAPKDAPKDFSSNYHYVTSDDYFLTYNYDLGEKGPTVGTVAKNKKKKHIEKFMTAPQKGGPLDLAVFDMGGERVAENLLKAKDLHVKGEEMIGGVSCKIVVGHTPYGQIKLWVSPEKGGCYLKFTVERTGEDLINGRPVSQTKSDIMDTGKKRPLLRLVHALNDVRIEEIEGHYVPVEGRYTDISFEREDVSKIRERIYHRSDVHFNPDFSRDPEAFKVQLPEKAMVNFLDDETSGVAYEWSDGKVSVATGPRNNEVQSFKNRQINLWRSIGINGVLISVLSLGFYLKRRRRSVSS